MVTICAVDIWWHARFLSPCTIRPLSQLAWDWLFSNATLTLCIRWTQLYRRAHAAIRGIQSDTKCISTRKHHFDGHFDENTVKEKKNIFVILGENPLWSNRLQESDYFAVYSNNVKNNKIRNTGDSQSFCFTRKAGRRDCTCSQNPQRDRCEVAGNN